MDNPQGAIEVPLSLFGGMTLELAPSDIPEGISAGCQDVVFLPGDVSSRPGLHRIFPVQPFTPGVRLVYQKTYIQTYGSIFPGGSPLNLYLTSDGKLWMENVILSPGTLSQIAQISLPTGSISDLTAVSVTFQGREYFAFSDGIHGCDSPLQYNGTLVERTTQDGPGQPCLVADSPTAGQVTPGLHNVVVMFQTTNGLVTAPSPATNWTAAGGKKVVVSNVPIGPNNVVARIIAFSGAGGFNFFYIPVTPTVAGQAVGTSTVIPDNTTTTATFDFSDNTLFNATAIDIPGNNLFECQPLPQSLGVFAYGDRLMYFGMDNKVVNFVNMGFDGGYISGAFGHPLGWNQDIPGANLQNRGAMGFECAFISTGVSPSAMLSQGAYQDSFFVPIIQPSTNYSAKFKAYGTAGASGNLIIEINSASAGTLCSGSLNLGLLTSIYRTFEIPMGFTTAAAIPSDAKLRVYLTGVPNAQGCIVDDLEIIYADTPFIDNRVIASYVGEPEQFDQLTGYFGPLTDPSPIKSCSILKDTMRIKTLAGMHTTNDNGTTEPSGWTVNTFDRSVGAVSIHAGDPGQFGSGDTAEDWDLTAARGGMYLDFAGDLFKVSQEIQPLWDSINWQYIQTMWIKNDTVTRRVYVALPTGSSFYPDKLAVLDYRELDAAYQISQAGPVHISFTGKMISSDLARKWTIWNIPALCGEVMLRPLNGREMCFGTWNLAANSYYLDPAKLTDDDLGQIFSFYITYAFLNHEAEVALGTGVHRKLYRFLSLFASGIGTLQVTPLVDALTNPWAMTPGFPLQATPYYDIENALNVTGERCFFKIESVPIQSQIIFLIDAQTVTVVNTNQFTVGQSLNIVSALGTSSIGTMVIQSLNNNNSTITFTTPLPVGTAVGYYVVGLNWPDNSFKLNKMVVSIQAEPHAPVRGDIVNAIPA